MTRKSRRCYFALQRLHHPVKHRRVTKTWQEEHPEWMRNNLNEWRKKNREHYNQQAREYYAKRKARPK